MAEALLRHIDSRNFDAFSAGVSGQDVHPLAIDVMREMGIDLGHKVAKTVANLGNEAFDFIITLDEATARQNYSFGAGETINWKFDSLETGSTDPETQRRAFRVVRDQIAQRLRLFVIVHSRPDVSRGPALPDAAIQQFRSANLPR